MEPLVLVLVPGVFGGLVLALILAGDRWKRSTTVVPRRLAAPSPALINMVIRNDAVGGIYDEYIASFSTATPFSPANASPPATASTNFAIQLALTSTNTSLFSSDALPAGVPVLAQFDFRPSFSLSFFDLAGNFGFVDATVTSVSEVVREVPEPDTMTLLGLALPAIAVRRRPVSPSSRRSFTAELE